ncbi:GNAT family N-acetyltransferase [Bacillus gobiensis]|uniref:GNAT family N-acetyltransferase n=1 Tax=Bacillus gobiensis TaxID=1441095 RepID=UPI003D1EBFB7
MQIVRLTEEKDILEAIKLSSYAFQNKVSEDRLEQVKRKYAGHDVFGSFENGKLLSKLHLISHESMIEETVMKMGGIAGVATWPEERRKGTVKKLLLHSLKTMRENQQAISFLHPFKISFYRKYGWEVAFYNKSYHLQAEHLKAIKPAGGYVNRLDETQATKVCGTIYDTYKKSANGLISRNSNYWKETVLKGYFNAVYYSEENEPLGYLIYDVEKKKMTVTEYVYLNREAQAGLWNFICQHDSMLDEVSMTVSETEDLDYRLDNPRIKQELHPYFMARIVDVKLFLELYPLRNNIDHSFLIRVHDEWAEWNHAVFSFNKHGVKLVNDEADSRILTVDIGSLTAFLLGARSARFLYETGKISGDKHEMERLDQTIQPKKTELKDFF